MDSQEGSPFAGADVVFSYSQEQALEDGVLAKVDPLLLKNAGFNAPLVITASVHAKCEPPAGTGNDYTGRLWDVLWMAANAFRMKRASLKSRPDDLEAELSLVPFKVIFTNAQGKQDTDTLWLCFTPSEGFTIMYPEDY